MAIGQDEALRLTIEAIDAFHGTMDKLNAQLDKTGNKLDQVKGSQDKANASVSKMPALFTAAIAAFSVEKILSGTYACIEAFGKQEEEEQQLIAVLKAHGTYSVELTEHYKALGAEIQKTTRYGDEEVISAEKLAATFGIMPDYMDRVITAATDMATVMGTNLNDAVLNFGKAMEGQYMNFQRLGIVIDDNLPPMERFDQLLNQINTRFGGAAKANIEGVNGTIVQLKNTFGDLQEAIGKAVVENADLVNIMDALATSIQFVTAHIGDLIDGVVLLLKYGTPLGLALTAINKVSGGALTGGEPSWNVPQGADKAKLEKIYADAMEKANKLAAPSLSFGTNLLAARKDMYSLEDIDKALDSPEGKEWAEKNKGDYGDLLEVLSAARESKMLLAPAPPPKETEFKDTAGDKAVMDYLKKSQDEINALRQQGYSDEESMLIKHNQELENINGQKLTNDQKQQMIDAENQRYQEALDAKGRENDRAASERAAEEARRLAEQQRKEDEQRNANSEKLINDYYKKVYDIELQGFSKIEQLNMEEAKAISDLSLGKYAPDKQAEMEQAIRDYYNAERQALLKEAQETREQLLGEIEGMRAETEDPREKIKNQIDQMRQDFIDTYGLEVYELQNMNEVYNEYLTQSTQQLGLTLKDSWGLFINEASAAMALQEAMAASTSDLYMQMSMNVGNMLGEMWAGERDWSKRMMQETEKLVGGIAQTWGKYFLLQGGVDLFINPPKGAAEIAGGIALIALGSALTSMAGRGEKTYGGGGGAGATPWGSTPPGTDEESIRNQANIIVDTRGASDKVATDIPTFTGLIVAEAVKAVGRNADYTIEIKE